MAAAAAQAARLGAGECSPRAPWAASPRIVEPIRNSGSSATNRNRPHFPVLHLGSCRCGRFSAPHFANTGGPVSKLKSPAFGAPGRALFGICGTFRRGATIGAIKQLPRARKCLSLAAPNTTLLSMVSLPATTELPILPMTHPPPLPTPTTNCQPKKPAAASPGRSHGLF
jgi:hypothetical protein